MITLEYLQEQKEKYEKKAKYFKNIDFEILSADYQGVVDLIEQIEQFVKEKQSEDNAE
jgi:hypothetical protein